MRTAEKRFVTVRLSDFVRDALCGRAPASAELMQARVVRAVRCYLNDKGSAGPGWAYPRFLRERGSAGAATEVRLCIDDRLWRSLEEEAASQGVTVHQMLAHALLYFAAEVNAGRITRRILEDLDSEAEGETGSSKPY